MELTDELVRELQVDLTLKTLPQVIQKLCQKPEGIIKTLLLANKQGIDPNAKNLLQKLDDGLQWFGEKINTDEWLKKSLLDCCGENASKNQDQQKSLLAEIYSYLQLSFCFQDKKVQQLDEHDGKNGKTPDFKVGDDLYVEVYCPDESDNHKKTVASLASMPKKQDGVTVNTIISHPITGNQTTAKKYASNQTLTIIISAKRKNDQTVEGATNIIWLDLSNKLKLNVMKTLPICSVKHGLDNYIGMNGIWHSFYGEKNKSFFAFERHSLRIPNHLSNYMQKDHNGLFRERPSLSAAIIECTDGVVIFQNPWADQPVNSELLMLLLKLNGFKPEYSWLNLSTTTNLEERVESELEQHKVLLTGSVELDNHSSQGKEVV